MVFYNNNRIDQAFYNNASIIAMGYGNNAPALVYNNAATNTQLNAIGGSENVITGFEIVNFNTLGINNIDLRVPFTTGMNPTGAAVYYNRTRNNCLIENTTKDMTIFSLIDYGFCRTNFAIVSLNKLAIYGNASNSNPTGYYTAKYVDCYERHGGSTFANWWATENLNGMPYGRTPGYSNMAAGNVLNLSGSRLTLDRHSTWTPDQLNVTGATTAYLSSFKGGAYWQSDGGLRVLSGVATAYLNDSFNICTYNAINAHTNNTYNVNYINGNNVYINSSRDIINVNGNNVYVNASYNINYINAVYAQLGNRTTLYTADNINVNCYNLNSFGSNIVANVTYFADVNLGSTLSNVNITAHHANITGGSKAYANLWSNTGVSYVTNTTNGYFNTNHDLFLNNVSNSNIIAKFVSYGSPSLNLVNNCQNCNFFVQELSPSYISNFGNTYNAFRNCNIYTPSNAISLLPVYTSISPASTYKDAFFNASFYNYNLNNWTNLGTTTFNWGNIDAPHFVNAFSYYAHPNITAHTNNDRANFNVALPCGSNINGSCLILGNALNVSSYELRTEIHLSPNGYATNSGSFGCYAYYNQNGHDTYICSNNLNNFINRKFVVMGLGLGSVSYPNGIASEKYMNALNTVLLCYSVPNCTVSNAWMVHIPSNANSLNGNWVRFSDCGPVYVLHSNSSTQYAFENTPNACIRGGGNFYCNSNMNIAVYGSNYRNFYIPDSVGEVHFDIKTVDNVYAYTRNIILYNLSSTWNKKTKIYVNAYDCRYYCYLSLKQFNNTSSNLKNVASFNANAKNTTIYDFASNDNLYFNNVNVYMENCELYAPASRIINFYSTYNSNIKLVNCTAPNPITLQRVAGQYVNFNVINCTNITVVN